VSYLNDGTLFRMPDSWYDPPEVREWKCAECGEMNTDEVCECGEREPDDEGEDPDDARDRMLEARWERD
jgi:hypothetical protein